MRKMTCALIVAAGFSLSSSFAFAQVSSCTGKVSNVVAGSVDAPVRVRGSYTNTANYGEMDPIIRLPVDVKGSPTCLVAHLSAYIEPADNHAIFRAEFNGRAMRGHGQSMPVYLPAAGSVTGPLISEPVHNLPRFFIQGIPSTHPNGPKPALHPDYPIRDNYLDRSRTVSYTFFLPVKGGDKGEIVLLAKGCCSGANKGNLSILSASFVAMY